MQRPVLRHNGKIVYIGETENDCYVKLHNCQPQSWAWAKKYEGYKVEAAEVNREDYTDEQWEELTYNGVICSYIRKKLKEADAS
jgi:hypothetical protein